MKGVMVAGIVGFMLGGMVSAIVTRHNDAARQHGLATMWLLQHHLDALKAQAQQKACVDARQSLARLQVVSEEIALAFPKAYAQESGFKQHADTLRSTVQQLSSADCQQLSDWPVQTHRVCEDCHRSLDG